MAKREIATTKVNPSFLTKYAEEDTSLDSMRQYRVLPRLKVVQGQTEAAVRDLVGVGGVALVPGNAVVCGVDESFLFVPLYQYTEFIQWRDARDKSDNAIVERTLDPFSEIAKLSRDEELREQEYEGGPKKDPWTMKYCEHINFVGVIYGNHELAGTLCGISFSRGEFFQGRSFCSAIMMRKAGGMTAPLWSGVWRFTSTQRSRGGYEWYGFDFQNAEEPWIKEDEAESFLELHQQMKELIESGNAGIDVAAGEVEEEEDEETEEM